MKRHFLTGLKALAVGVMTLLAVSCYDDSKLWEGIEDLKGRVSALEQKLNEQVETLNAEIAKLDAKVAVVDVKKVEDNYVLTFADGSKLTVAAGGTKGFVTTVDIEGTTFWAILDENGEPQILDAVVHPDTQLKFSVNPDTYEVSVSYDNGKTWVPTGVKVKDETTLNVFTALDYKEGADFLTITVGGKQYRLPVYNDDTSSIVLGRSDFFLRYEGVKEVTLTAVDMPEYYVMSKPDGWKASLVDNVLTVTAPTKAAVKIGAAETEGEILVHATTTEGKCKIAKIDVTAGEGLTLDVDADGNVTIKNAYTSVQVNEQMETESFGFSPFTIGIMPAAEYYSFEEYFEMTFEEAWMEYQQPPCEWAAVNFYNNRPESEYVEGEYEVDVIETTMSEILLNDCMAYGYEKFPYGAFVVFAAHLDDKGLPTDGIIVTEYINVNLSVEVVTTSHNEVKVKVVAEGADSYLIGGVAQSTYLDGYMGPQTFDEYMTNESMMAMGPWAAFANGGYPGNLGQIVTEFPEEAFAASSYVGFGAPFTFDSSYDFWVMPMFDHMAKLDMMQSEPDYGYYIYTDVKYDYEKNFKPYVQTLKTNPLVAGAPEAELELDEDATNYSSVTVAVSAADDAEVKYAFYTPSVFDAMTDEELFDDIIAEGYSLYSTTVEKTDLKAGDAVVLAVMTITADGKYSIVSDTFYAKAAPTEVDTNLTAQFGEPTADFSSISVMVTPSAGATMYWAYMTDSLMKTYAETADLLAYILAKGKSATSATTCKVTSVNAGDSRTLVVVVVGENGKYNIYSDKKYSTKSYPYSDALTVALDGKVDFTITDEVFDEGTVKATFNVTGAEKVVVYCGYSGGENSFVANVVNGKTTGTNYKVLDVVDGKVTVEYTEIGNYMWLYAMAFTTDLEGKVNAISKAVSTPVAE